MGADVPTVPSRPASSQGTRPVSAPANPSQQQIPESNVQSKGSRNEQREGTEGAKSREASKLRERPERSGSAVSSVKPNSAIKSQTSSKKTSPIPGKFSLLSISTLPLLCVTLIRSYNRGCGYKS